MNDRRHFVMQLFGGLAAARTLPAGRSRAREAFGRLQQAAASLGDAPPDEVFWQVVKDQFPLRSNLILMNAANLCPAPYPVIDAVVSLTRDVDADASFQNRAKFTLLRERARALVARHLGAEPEEIAITRNTSEGNNTVINGVTLGRGDDVVIWDQNHPTNNVAWDVRAERYGYAVKRVATPVKPSSDADLIMPFERALTSRTKVLSFSHVSNVSGVGLPAKRLCTMARDRGILTLVDGAQTFGAGRVDLHDMGCDFYTGSAHKWFVGPKEAGVLYVRRDAIPGLWPSDVGVGWADALEHGARKFDNLGQRDDAAVAAMGTTADFHDTIGIDRIETRVRQLAAGLKDRLTARIPSIEFVTPLAPDLSLGVVIFTVAGMDGRRAHQQLYEEDHIACAAMGGGLRFCPHIYNTMEEVERVVEAVAGVAT